MSDEDFGTVAARRGERAREIEILRAHYRRHRETLNNLALEAPSEHLAVEYRKLVQEIDSAILKLDEIEGRPSGAVPVAPVQGAALRSRTEPGMRPLVTPREEAETFGEVEPDTSRSRLALIVAGALVTLALIGWLIWRASSDREPPGAVVDQATDTVTTIAEEAPVTPAPPPPALLAISPEANDYGVIRKGTRATRQFEVTNASEEPVSIQLARSACRCLYYEYSEVVPPKGKESVTVTVDGARAPAGELRESVKVSAKNNPAVATSFDVIATIR